MSFFGPGAGLPMGGTPEETMENFARLRLEKNLPLNVGAVMIGFIIDLFLFGVTCHQYIVFLRNPMKDRGTLKSLVAWTFTMGACTTGYGMYYIYSLFVNDFGKFLNFLLMDKVAFYPGMAVAVMVPVQVFYLNRAYRLLQRRKWILILVLPLILTLTVGAFGLTVVMVRLKSVADLATLNVWFYLWDVTTLATDVSLTILMLFGLVKARTGWSTTDALVSRLIRTSAEAQLFPTLVAIGFLCTYAITPQGQMNGFWNMMLGKSYVVSLLAVLNFRVTSVPTTMGDTDVDFRDKKRSDYSSPTQLDQPIPLQSLHLRTEGVEAPRLPTAVPTLTYSDATELGADHFHRSNFTPRMS